MDKSKKLKSASVSNGVTPYKKSTNINLRFTRKLLMIAIVSLGLASAALPAPAANWWTQAPHISYGSASLNVRNFGALGNGYHDDTAAIQAAIDALPSSGGTVMVPSGTYKINALRAINLRSNMRLMLNANATLSAIANSAQRSWVVKVWNVDNVEIVGGQVVGDRVGHRGNSGEWGYGINISGASQVFVHDIGISNAWGDGILVGATGSGKNLDVSTNVTLNHVTATNNRRQGLTVTPCNQLYVVNSSFSSTNGTAPEAGIDIEPLLQGSTQQVRIENTTLSNNGGNGLEIHNFVSGVVLTGSTAENNQGYGVFAAGATNLSFLDNTLNGNYLFGVAMLGLTNNVQITGNTVMWNGAAWYHANHKPITTRSNTLRDIQIGGDAWSIAQHNNVISPKP